MHHHLARTSLIPTAADIFLFRFCLSLFMEEFIFQFNTMRIEKRVMPAINSQLYVSFYVSFIPQLTSDLPVTNIQDKGANI